MKKSSLNGVTVRKVDEPTSWDGFFKAFLKLLPSVSQSIDQRTIFCDVCRIFSLSIRGAVTLDEKEKSEIEKQYMSFVSKYGNEGMMKISVLLSYVVQALELRRSDFLGHVYEALSATNKHFGQYLTPDSVARMMARMSVSGKTPETGKIIRMNDCSCGAGALLIEAAEAFIDCGGRQCDLILYGEDLDPTASYISYVQFSLLGYAAVVTHQDSLSMQVYEGPWYTPCYFAHGMPIRLMAEGMAEKSAELKGEVVPKDDKPIDIRGLVQGEFAF